MENVNEQINIELVKKELELLTEEYKKIAHRKSKIFFNRLFKPKKLYEENSEYISLRALKDILWTCTSNYCSDIYEYASSITRNVATFYTMTKTYVEDSIVYVVETGINLMSVDCTTLPRLINGDTEKYEKVKKYIYELVPIHKEYVEFLNTFENTIKLGEISKIIISNEYGISKPNIVLKIGEFALFEICNESSNSYSIITFSNDLEISRYLDERKDELFERIFIPKEKIAYLLNVYKRIMKVDTNIK